VVNADSAIAMKVHHDGLLRAQPDELAGETGVPGIQEDIVDSDMAEQNGLNGDYDEADTA
jgi:hypothetical protein